MPSSSLIIVDAPFASAAIASSDPSLGPEDVVRCLLATVANHVVDPLGFRTVRGSDPFQRVRVVVEGLASGDALHRRRNDAHVRAASLRSPDDWHAGLFLPGTRAGAALVDAVRLRGWECHSAVGSTSSTICKMIRDELDTDAEIQHSGDDTIVVISRKEDIDVVVGMACSMGHPRTLQDTWVTGPTSVGISAVAFKVVRALRAVGVDDDLDAPDALVVDVLSDASGRGLSPVQGLPSLPRMTVTCPMAVDALWESYASLRARAVHLTRRGGAATGSRAFSLDRVALEAMLRAYVEARPGGEDDDDVVLSPPRRPEGRLSGSRWRASRRDLVFPHGSERVCEDYLDALERELAHACGEAPPPSLRLDAYFHGVAPSALELADHLASTRGEDTHRELDLRPLIPWDDGTQLLATLPISAASSIADPGLLASARELHARLELGCAHMFPTSYSVWWDRFAVIPVLDPRLVVAARAQAGAYK